MLATERRKIIIEYLESHRSVSVTELCEILDVSDMTVRRDLRQLSDNGLIQRVHGGATLRQGRSYEPPYMTREASNRAEKEVIGRRAARMVREGMSLAIDVGTTTVELAQNLVNMSELTIITSSLRVANVLSDASNIRLILAGGVLRPHEMSMFGHITTSTYRGFQVDTAFTGVGGIDLDTGLTEFNLEDALVKQTIMQHAAQVVVVADSSKLHTTCFVNVAPIEAMDVLITDWKADADMINQLEARGVEVLIAAPDD